MALWTFDPFSGITTYMLYSVKRSSNITCHFANVHFLVSIVPQMLSVSQKYGVIYVVRKIRFLSI